MTTAIIDYGSGNLRSAEKAFQRMSAETGGGAVVVTSDPDVVAKADRIVLPGVGAFGMQLMATRGLEHGETPGFDWIHGDVVRLQPNDPALKVPHMGWNELTVGDHPVLEGIETGDHAYFVHSYHLRPRNPEQRLAHTAHGEMIAAVVGRGNMVGTQFHPEKSQQTGLRLIANFLRWKP
jgi:glutamine amidotransferase